MTKPLKLLLIEDTDDDERLVLRELKRGGYDVRHQRVQTADAMREALAQDTWDLVLSDYSLPTFSAPAALAVLKQSGTDLPFIILSGTIGEETAVDALHAGAHDFLVKSRLARLIPAIEREMRDAAARREYVASEQQKKLLEEQLRQAQKMEAIGRLAGGVAHDFNNILTAIIATADLALESGGLSDELKADLQTIRDSGRRAAGITRQLLTFSRKQVEQVRPLDVNEVTRGAESLLRRLLPRGVTLEMDLAATRDVEADPTQIEQVLLNLVVNAADAMPSGGRITVSTADVEAEATAPGSGNGGAPRPGHYVAIRVRDTGIGMDAATQALIFEPFFTTKEPGRGTGLGLATVYGIVTQRGGHIQVHSKPGEGALFEVLLPRVEESPAVVTPSAVKPPKLDGSEVILVVVNETALRAPIGRTLRQFHYFVLEARDGDDALAVLREHHAPVHLLITDVAMAGPSGSELIRQLRDWYPQVRVLFITDRTDASAATANTLIGARNLTKPFTTSQLGMAARELLDAIPTRSSATPQVR